MSLDPLVIPLVKLFNDSGLKTCMSCQGHNSTDQSMFWIQFDSTVSEKDILAFMQKHLSKCGTFCSCGRFAKRLLGFYSVKDLEWRSEEHWCYFAATVDAADEDLRRWTHDAGEWKGVEDEEYMAWRNQILSKQEVTSL